MLPRVARLILTELDTSTLAFSFPLLLLFSPPSLPLSVEWINNLLRVFPVIFYGIMTSNLATTRRRRAAVARAGKPIMPIHLRKLRVRQAE